MHTVLHVESSGNFEGHSRKIGAKLVNKIKEASPNIKLIERDVVKNAVPHITPEFIKSLRTPGAKELELSNTLVQELVESNIIIIESPMYNFSIPSNLKAWVDHIARAGMTFRYTESGRPEGLLKGKKAILIVARGGIYSQGEGKEMDHQESYLRTILHFIGITDIETIHIEATNMGDNMVKDSIAKAEAKIDSIAKAIFNQS